MLAIWTFAHVCVYLMMRFIGSNGKFRKMMSHFRTLLPALFENCLWTRLPLHPPLNIYGVLLSSNADTENTEIVHEDHWNKIAKLLVCWPPREREIWGESVYSGFSEFCGSLDFWSFGFSFSWNVVKYLTNMVIFLGQMTDRSSLICCCHDKPLNWMFSGHFDIQYSVCSVWLWWW